MPSPPARPPRPRRQPPRGALSSCFWTNSPCWPSPRRSSRCALPTGWPASRSIPGRWRARTAGMRSVRTALRSTSRHGAGRDRPRQHRAGLRRHRCRPRHHQARAELAAARGPARRHRGGLCTGAYALAKAGLLDSKKATIHWENQDGFLEEFEDVKLTKSVFVMDGNRWTTARAAPRRWI